MSRNLRWVLVILVVSCLVLAMEASEGDSDPLYKSCVDQCQKTGCVGDNCFHHCKFSADGKSIDGPWYMQEPLYLRWKQWDCQSDCQYECMMTREEERKRNGEKPTKYFGKWPLKHVYGIQEPVSVAFSALDLAIQFHGWVSYFILVYYNLPLQPNRKTYYEYNGLLHIYAVIVMNALFWSGVCHSRDVEITERLDYSSATILVGFTLILAIFRSFSIRDKSAKVMITAPILAVATTHILYINFYNLDEGLHRKVLFGIGGIELVVWGLWAALTSHPSKWKLRAFFVSSILTMCIRMFDFPPYKGYVDAHALWRAAGIPLSYLWWSFDPPPSSQTTVNSQDGQQAMSNVQPQGQIQAIQPAQAPVAMIPPPSFLSRFRWYHAALAVGVLAASGAGTAVFVKKSLIPRLKSWVRRIMLEEEEEADPLKKVDGKPSLAEEAVAAAKAASAAASDVARVSQEMMKTKNDEMKYFEDLTNLLGVQVQEMKSLSNNFRRLEGRSKNPPKVYSAEQEGYGGSITTATERRPYANGSNTDYDTRSARSASPPAPPPAPPSDSSAPPHPKSYMDIMSMIQRGEKPSNIREINDMPPNPNQQLSSSRIAPKTKPWDSGQAPQEDGSNGSWWQQKNPRSTDFGYETTVARSVGIQNETTTMEPAAFQRQKSWVPPQPPPVVMPEAAEAIRRPKPQAKIDQEAAASDDQSGVSDELQKITKFSESGGDGSERSQISEIQEETEEQQMNHEGN